jgi:anthranilate phosphoribosyltransferase
MNDPLRHALERLRRGEGLDVATARGLFDGIMDEALAAPAVAAVIGALLVKGESVEELVGAAQAMRARVIRVRCDDARAIDTCGTGGDGVSTFNVSTTAAIIAAAAGATVAKHGNRSSTRRSGSTEVLTELGIDVDAEPTVVERSLRDAGIGYLNARQLHPAMKAVAAIRQAIPVRTIFNLLGPLTNPAGVRRQLVGVPRMDLLETVAGALQRLGVEHAWVVHGYGSICDLSIAGASTVCEVTQSGIVRFEVDPAHAGLPRGELRDLMVESPQESARAVRSILSGEPGTRRNHALWNAGAALVVAGLAPSLPEGVGKAAAAIDSGAAAGKLRQWVEQQGGSKSPTPGSATN